MNPDFCFKKPRNPYENYPERLRVFKYADPLPKALRPLPLSCMRYLESRVKLQEMEAFVLPPLALCLHSHSPPSWPDALQPEDQGGARHDVTA